MPVKKSWAIFHLFYFELLDYILKEDQQFHADMSLRKCP